MNIIVYRKIFLSFSGILVLASIAAIAVFGLNPGIDFVGGTVWHIKIVAGPTLGVEELKNFFKEELNVKNPVIYEERSTDSLFIRLSHLSNEEHSRYLSSMEEKYGDIEELRFETIGPTIGEELKRKSIWAVVLVLLGISLYVAFAFRKVSHPVKSWKYGVIALVTLFHDAIIPIGLFAFLGWRSGVEIDVNFIVAILVVMGFSVHDTIVVFDRIRENLLLAKNRLDLGDIVSDSIKQTIVRSINTSLTLVLALLALFFFGPVSLKYFVLAMLVGVIAGTYSSICVASPLLIISHRRKN